MKNSLIQIGTPPVGSYDGILMRANPMLHEEAFGILTNHAASGARVIDVGSGQGAFAARLRDSGYSVVCVDKNPSDFRASDVKFVAVDFDIPGQIETFTRDHREGYDVAVGMEVIEHVENPWEYCRFLLSLVRPNGIVLLTTPNAESVQSRLDFLFSGIFAHFGRSDYVQSGHINPLTFQELHLIAEALGAETVSASAICPLPWLIVSRRPSVVFGSIFASLLRPFVGAKAKGDIICFVLRKTC
jgi:2-polyprenyl-3-methyl-5-hydroxy-6-metoxy-1,4-benzoquinol methylase